MKKLVLATASVFALGLGVATAQPTAPSTTSPSMTTPPTTTAPMPQSSSQSQPSQTQPSQTQPMNLSESQIKQVQQELKTSGLYKGTIDGQMGPETKQAVQQFQQQKGFKATGEVDNETFQALNGGAAPTGTGGATQPPTTNQPR